MKKLMSIALVAVMISAAPAQASLWGDIKGGVNKIASDAGKVLSKGGQATTQIGQAALNEINEIKRKATDIAQKMQKFVSDAVNFVKALLTETQDSIKSVESSIDAIKPTIPKIQTDVTGLIDAAKKIPSQLQAATTQPIKDLEATATGLEADLGAAVKALEGNLNKTIADMKTNINAGKQKVEAGNIEQGVPDLVNALEAVSSGMVTSLAQATENFSKVLNKATAGTTKSIEGMIKNSAGIKWQPVVLDSIDIIEQLLIAIVSIKKVLTEVNHTVATVGNKSFSLIGDFTDVSTAQNKLNELTIKDAAGKPGDIPQVLNEVDQIIKNLQDGIAQVKTTIGKTQTTGK